MYKFRLTAILLCFFTFNSWGQKIERFEHINTSDGLSQNGVISIQNDSKGFMWFGTMNGLNRYDGHNFKIYKVEEGKANTLTHNRIDRIWEDKNRILWVQTRDNLIHYFIPDSEEFITVPHDFFSYNDIHGGVTAFEQFSTNEIWIGTNQYGAIRLIYNDKNKRYELKEVFGSENKKISSNKINFLKELPSDRVLIGTELGLNIINYGTPASKTLSYDLDWSFTHAVTIHGCVYVATNKGIKKYNSGSSTFEDCDFFHLDFASDITLMRKSNDNNLIIGTDKQGVFLIDVHQNIGVQKLADAHITDIFEDAFQEIWVRTSKNEIYKYSSHSQAIKKYDFDPEEQDAFVNIERQVFYENGKGELWINMQWGLAHYQREKDLFEVYKHHHNDPSSISSKMITCLTEDKSGTLWIGTGQPNGGVNKVIRRHPSFTQIIPKNEIKYKENTIRSMLKDRNNMVWAGTKSGKLYISPSEDFMKAPHIITIDLGKGHGIYSIMEDQEGRIWVGTKGGGLFVSKNTINDPAFYEHVKFSSYRYVPEKLSGLNSDIIYAVYQDSKGRIWIGNFGGGLQLVESLTENAIVCKTFNTLNSNISNDKIRNIFEDSQSRLWVATALGLNLVEGAENDIAFYTYFHHPDNAKSLSYNDIIHIFEDSKSGLWFTTLGGGINRLRTFDPSSKNASFEHITQTDGLINNVVYSILEDGDGFLWFSTDGGISRFDSKNNTFLNYDKSIGLIYNNFSEDTGCKISDENLVFGNEEGLLQINPKKLPKNSFTPEIVLTNFQIFNKDIDHRQPDSPLKQTIETLSEVTLKYFQSSFSIEYVALNYDAFTKNSYRYKLENFDREWNEVGRQRKATYTNLKPGKYHFMVQVSNGEGDWIEHSQVLTIVISPPWYATTLAYFCYLILIVLVLEIFRRYYIRYINLQNDLKVEKRVNDIKLRFFTNISHEIRTPLTLILGPIDDIKRESQLPENVKQKLLIMERNGKRMLRLVNQLLDFRKIQKQKMKLLVQETELISFLKSQIINFEQLILQKKIDFQFKTSSTGSIPVWVDCKQFDSVVFNLLSNALKFTEEGKKVSIEVNDKSLNHIDIIIEDEGPGIPKDKQALLFRRFNSFAAPDANIESSGIGLQLAYEIMKLHKGDILVKSEPEKGSKFIIRILKGFRHYKDNVIKSRGLQYSECEKCDPIINNEPSQEKSPGTHHILIVEDNEEIIHYLYLSLNHSYQLNHVKNGIEALAFLEKNQPDLIITDVMMQGMDGVEMTQRIKKSFALSHIPVIMLTAKSNMEDQVAGIDSGAEAYILKPFNMKHLHAVISNLIRQREAILQKYLKGEILKQGKKPSLEISVSIDSKDEEFLQNLVSIIENNYKEPDFNVEKLVEHTSLSRTLFYNKIKTLTGLSPNEFLRQMRLKIAGNLLLEPGYNVTEVAYITGFNNVKYFRKHFKDMYGINPLEYKKFHEESKKAPLEKIID